MTAYTVVIDESGSYTLEIQQDNGPPEVISAFKTDVEANEYMQDRLRRQEDLDNSLA